MTTTISSSTDESRGDCGCSHSIAHPGASPPRVEVTPGSLKRNFLETAQGITSATIFLLLPKCPVCIAAYVAAGTGIGLSLTVANGLRLLVLFLAALTVTCLAVKHFWRHAISSPART